jgi:hypothetical protein
MNECEIADHLAITDKIDRCCRAVDRLDVPFGHSVFHPDSYADCGDADKGTGCGWIDYICCKAHRKYPHHPHQVTNVIIDVYGDRSGPEAHGTATLRIRDENRIMQRQY